MSHKVPVQRIAAPCRPSGFFENPVQVNGADVFLEGRFVAGHNHHILPMPFILGKPVLKVPL